MILVTGATGTVGKALCRRLAASKVPARGLTRDAAKAVGGGGGGKGDIATAGGKHPDGLDEALRIAKAAAGS